MKLAEVIAGFGTVVAAIGFGCFEGEVVRDAEAGIDEEGGGGGGGGEDLV